MTKTGNQSYSGILKSAAILGSARAMNILIGMVRVKLLALLIGPTGVGLFGLYDTIAVMASTISGLGVSISGVREMAQSAGSSDKDRIARTSKTLRRAVFVLGLIGTLATAALALPISHLTFDDSEHVLPIIFLSTVVLMISVAGGRCAVVQGMGRIADLAKVNLLYAGLGSVVTVALFWAWGEKAIVPAVMSTYGSYLLVAWWYGRRIKLPEASITWKESLNETGPLVRLGLAMMNAALLASLVAYATRSLIARDLGMSAVGIYLCAFSLSGKFVGFITDAMWTDFYPRASLVGHDHAALNKVVNEQTEVALLLAIPGLIATVVFAPWLVYLFYTDAFGEATLLIRWFTLGCLGGVISGPMRIVQLAKGKSLLCFLTETCTSAIHIAMVFALLKVLSLPGSAIAYVAHNLFQLFLSMYVAHRLTGFKWSTGTVKMMLTLVPIAVALFVATLFVTDIQAALIGGVVNFAVSVFCLKQLTVRLGAEHRLSRFLARSPIIGPILMRP